jgi:hypothetical protein
MSSVFKDMQQHYYGWVAYRQSSWNFPFGQTDLLTYPNSRSIFYTDSIPILAVFFKLLSPILPDTFQYLGIFGFFSLVLQSAFGTVIFKKLRCNTFVSIAGGGLLTIMPIIFLRMYHHTSLSAQWIILAAVYLWISENSIKNKKLLHLLWAVLAFIATGTHIYFAAMVFAVIFARTLHYQIVKFSIKSIILNFTFPVISVLSALYIFGAFVGELSPVEGIDGLEIFVTNINGFYNPYRFSRFFKELPTASGSSEGLAYLGLGVLSIMVLLIAILVYKVIVNKFFRRNVEKPSKNSPKVKFSILRWIKNNPFKFSIIVLILLSFVISLGTNPSFNEHKLFTLHLPNIILELWSIFRATGRFVWIAVYLVTISVIVLLSRNVKNKYILNIAVILALGVQYADVNPFIGDNLKENLPYSSRLSNSFWKELEGYNHINTLGFKMEEYLVFSEIFLKQGISFNNYYLARTTPNNYFVYDNNSLVISNNEAFFTDYLTDYRHTEVDGYFVGVKDGTEGNFFELASAYQLDIR